MNQLAPHTTLTAEVTAALSHPELLALPESCLVPLRAVLATAQKLAPADMHWLQATSKAAMGSTLLEAQGYAQHDPLCRARQDAWDAAWAALTRLLPEQVGCEANTTLGAVTFDLHRDNALALLDPWVRGTLLAFWARDASPGAVEIARSLLPEWQGSVQDLQATATSLLASTPV